jgi:cysteine synthase
MKAHNILETIGHTPNIRMNRLFGADAQVWIKSERSNTELASGAKVLDFNYDTGERYLSVKGYLPA